MSRHDDDDHFHSADGSTVRLLITDFHRLRSSLFLNCSFIQSEIQLQTIFNSTILLLLMTGQHGGRYDPQPVTRSSE